MPSSVGVFVCVCDLFVTCEVRVCGLRCDSGSSIYIYRVYLYLLTTPVDRQDPLPIFRCPDNALMLRWVFPDQLITQDFYFLTSGSWVHPRILRQRVCWRRTGAEQPTETPSSHGGARGARVQS